MSTQSEPITFCSQCSGCEDVRPKSRHQIDWKRVAMFTTAVVLAALCLWFSITHLDELTHQPPSPMMIFFG
ncbi:MAG TPA: hypothetical protein VE866_03590 [Candidatus Binatia bacterium]|nr:hypothetical protein [Candidatus Binatia bacterium]